MRTFLRVALPFVLAGFAVACSSQATAPAEGDDSTKPGGEDTTPADTTPAPAPAATAPAPVTPAVATAKIHDAPVVDYAVTGDALWIATGTDVERTASDGTAKTKLPALAGANALAANSTHVFATVRKSSVQYDFLSTKGDGSESQVLAGWNGRNGAPTTLALNGTKIFFMARNLGELVSLDTTTKNFQWEEDVDGQIVPPAFATDRFFAVDYRIPSLLRKVFVDPRGVDVIVDDVPALAGGVATDATDVFTRTRAGIVKAPVASGAGTAPTVLVPSATCSVIDPGTGDDDQLEDALAADGATIYTACRAAANVEIRAYGKDGALVKVVATQPFRGSVTHLRVTANAVYWLSGTRTETSSNELWRAAR